MALRLVDIYRPDDDDPLALPDDTYSPLGHWTYSLDGDGQVDRVLVDADETEALLDWVDQATQAEYRVALRTVEATLPRPETDEDDASPSDAGAEESSSGNRLGRAELYEYARTASDVSGSYYALVLLSVVVAAGGMLRDQTAIVIGAMVIAPLIGPNVALALGTTLGDTALLARSAWATVTGVAGAFGLALGLGVAVPVDPTTGEVAARTIIGLADVALAGAAGAAGALSVTRDGATSLVGVMVAVALLPRWWEPGCFWATGIWLKHGPQGFLPSPMWPPSTWPPYAPSWCRACVLDTGGRSSRPARPFALHWCSGQPSSQPWSPPCGWACSHAYTVVDESRLPDVAAIPVSAPGGARRPQDTRRQGQGVQCRSGPQKQHPRGCGTRGSFG